MSSSLDNPDKLHPPTFSREHRLGLVVSGGISLAIYMNGICQEFYNAVRGRGIYKLLKALTDADIVVDIISGTSAGGVNGVLLSYALANSQGKKWIKFEEFAKVWKDSGDIEKLFFTSDFDQVNKSSLFNGKGYYRKKIKEALINREADLKENSSQDDWVSDFEELDLFITGTDLLGRIYQVFDNTRRVIEVKDHRTVFHLKYREHVDNNFNHDETTCDALAKLCQITSCFPLAFPPVTVQLKSEDKKGQGNKKEDEEVDKKLVEWGDLKKNRILPEEGKVQPDPSKASNAGNNNQQKLKEIEDDPGEGYRIHFVDGGVLDNRPFTYTIKAIYHRAANRPVFRKLFYVDPSPDRFKDNYRYQQMLKPNVFQVVLDAMSGVPRYESINNDLELINEHNEKVLRYRFLLTDLESLLDFKEEDISNRDFYDQQRNVYLRTRLISLEDKLLPLIFLESLESKDLESEDIKDTISSEERTQKSKEAAELLNKPLTDPTGSSERLKLLKDLAEQIRYLDIDYALRQYFFITEYVYRLLDPDYLKEWLKNKTKIENPTINKELLDSLRNLISKLNDYRNVIEVIKEKTDKLFKSNEIERYFFELLTKFPNDKFPEKFYKSMLWLHGKFLDIELPSNLKIQQLTSLLEGKLCKVKKSLNELNDFDFVTSKEKLKKLGNNSILQKLLERQKLEELLKESNENENINFNKIKEKLLNYFGNFDKLDTVLYPLDYLAGIPEKQLIETFRISPEDAKLGFSSHSKFEDGNRLEKKLAGDSLNAFGGFLKESWRANDILWGRLDGFNRIVDALITKDKIKNFKKFLDEQAQKNKIDLSEYLDRLLEKALSPDFDSKRKSNSEEDKEYLRKKKDDLKKEILENLIPKIEKKELEDEYLEGFRQSLVSIGHLLILDQEFEETMKTSIKEQLDWQQQKKSQPKSSNQECENAGQNCSEEKSDGKQQKQQHKESIIKFDPINLSFDSAITALVVEELAKNSLASMSLEKKEEFFNEKYNIGLETWEHLPQPKLKEIIDRVTYISLDIFATLLRTNANGTRSEKPISSISKFLEKQKLIIVRSLIINFAIRVLKDKRFLVLLVLFVSLVFLILFIAALF